MGRLEAGETVFGAHARVTGSLTGNGNPHYVQLRLSAKCLVPLGVRWEESRELGASFAAVLAHVLPEPEKAPCQLHEDKAAVLGKHGRLGGLAGDGWFFPMLFALWFSFAAPRRYRDSTVIARMANDHGGWRRRQWRLASLPSARGREYSNT